MLLHVSIMQARLLLSANQHTKFEVPMIYLLCKDRVWAPKFKEMGHMTLTRLAMPIIWGSLSSQG